MPTPEILVSYQLEPENRERLTAALPEGSKVRFLADISSNERADAIAGAEVVVTWSPSKEFDVAEMGRLKRLRLLQVLTAGVDHLPFRDLPEGVLIASNPGAYAEPMAEHILGLALALGKRLCRQHKRLAAGVFDQETKNRLLRGRTFGVLGFGGIGQAAARLMRGLGLSILALNTSGRTSEQVEFVGTLDDLEYVLQNADILLVCVPLTRRTKNLIGDRELALMKPDAILINSARGAIIDEGALYRRLLDHPDFCAGIDAWWIEPSMGGEFKVHYPFFDLPNFLGSPHNSPIVPGTLHNAVRMAGENVARFLRGEQIKGLVLAEDYIED
ncbi:MAG: 2-hydroxyacid dehydrogenase [Syntrophobacteraceae bacterium]